ncbi:MAG: diguanylate cyclase [Spirochaetes bacterium]|nr:diguanylate cyclase [Spirochaetota bacterium]
MDDVIKGFEAGGVDYITRPFNALELLARVDTHISLMAAHNDLKTYNESLEILSQQLLEKTKILDTMVRTDFLTGLANRMHMLDQLKREESRFRRGTPLCSVIISDIDYFKSINDTFGHEAGDNVLRAVADVFRNNTRKQDVIARWGGEEFLFLLPETPGNSAYKAAEKIRIAVSQIIIPDIKGDIHVTMTFGVCEFDLDLSIDGTIRMADSALYAGKLRGRNCVEMVIKDTTSNQSTEDP